MTAPSIHRWTLLGGALVATLLLVWQSSPEESMLVQPRHMAVARAIPVEAVPARFALTEREPAAEAYIDLFRPRDVKLVRQAAASAAAVPPMPPPLPFTFVGRMVEDGRTKVFLQEGEVLHVVAEGDRLGIRYQVVGLEGSRLELLYLPLNMTQTIRIGNHLE